MLVQNASRIAAAVAGRQAEFAAGLRGLSADELTAPSLLPGWDRLTIICHLRYGAEASHAMTLDVLAGRDASFYPEGRTRQRPATLRPRDREQPSDVVDSFIEASKGLSECWATLGIAQWKLVAREPQNNVDLGPTTLGLLALLRLTEVEVHGSDSDIGLGPWSDVFVDSALPMRLRWLPSRRSSNSWVDTGIVGTWVLRSTEGPAFAVTSDVDGVSVSEGGDLAGDTELTGPKRDLLAFLLGRLDVTRLRVTGDRDLAQSFHRAFPAP